MPGHMKITPEGLSPWRTRHPRVAGTVPKVRRYRSSRSSTRGGVPHCGMAAREVAEGQGRAERGAATRVCGAKHAGGGVAGGIQAWDHGAVVAEDACVFVDAWAAVGAQGAVVERHCIERRTLDRAE